MKGGANKPLGSKTQILRREGLQALQNRMLDSSEDQKRLRKLTQLTESEDRLKGGFGPVPVLNLSPLPPSPILSDSQVQMLDRLQAERRLRTVALAYPKDNAWWLEVWSDQLSWIQPLGSKTNFIKMIADAARRVRAKVVHIESALGLPLSLTEGLESSGLKTVLSIHDFTFFCRRPYLIEQPSNRFCEFSQDPERCAECLRDIDPERRHTQKDYRRQSAAALKSASLVIFPSKFLQRKYQTLFPTRQPAQREVVIAPISARVGAKGIDASDRSNIAFVGGVYPHTGGALIAPIMEHIREQVKKASGFVYGSGESELLRQAGHAKGLRIRGYYRPGTLPGLLRRDKIAVAVLPSIWPEGYATVVDECLATGVPVVAFDLGAAADRLSFWEVGERVPRDLGAEGLAEAAANILSREGGVPDSVIMALPQADRTARKHFDLYRSFRPRKR